jgi:hypothetical protein
LQTGVDALKSERVILALEDFIIEYLQHSHWSGALRHARRRFPRFDKLSYNAAAPARRSAKSP